MFWFPWNNGVVGDIGVVGGTCGGGGSGMSIDTNFDVDVAGTYTLYD